MSIKEIAIYGFHGFDDTDPITIKLNPKYNFFYEEFGENLNNAINFILNPKYECPRWSSIFQANKNGFVHIYFNKNKKLKMENVKRNFNVSTNNVLINNKFKVPIKDYHLMYISTSQLTINSDFKGLWLTGINYQLKNMEERRDSTIILQTKNHIKHKQLKKLCYNFDKIEAIQNDLLAIDYILKFGTTVANPTRLKQMQIKLKSMKNQKYLITKINELKLKKNELEKQDHLLDNTNQLTDHLNKIKIEINKFKNDIKELESIENFKNYTKNEKNFQIYIDSIRNIKNDNYFIDEQLTNRKIAIIDNNELNSKYKSDIYENKLIIPLLNVSQNALNINKLLLIKNTQELQCKIKNYENDLRTNELHVECIEADESKLCEAFTQEINKQQDLKILLKNSYHNLATETYQLFQNDINLDFMIFKNLKLNIVDYRKCVQILIEFFDLSTIEEIEKFDDIMNKLDNENIKNDYQGRFIDHIEFIDNLSFDVKCNLQIAIKDLFFIHIFKTTESAEIMKDILLTKLQHGNSLIIALDNLPNDELPKINQHQAFFPITKFIKTSNEAVKLLLNNFIVLNTNTYIIEYLSSQFKRTCVCLLQSNCYFKNMLKFPEEILIIPIWKEFNNMKSKINNTKVLLFQIHNMRLIYFRQYTNDQYIFSELSYSRDKCIQICTQRRYLLKLKHLKMDIISRIKNAIIELQSDENHINGILQMIENNTLNNNNNIIELMIKISNSYLFIEQSNNANMNGIHNVIVNFNDSDLQNELNRNSYFYNWKPALYLDVTDTKYFLDEKLLYLNNVLSKIIELQNVKQEGHKIVIENRKKLTYELSRCTINITDLQQRLTHRRSLDQELAELVERNNYTFSNEVLGKFKNFTNDQLTEQKSMLQNNLEECQHIVKHFNERQVRRALNLNLKQCNGNKFIANIQDYFLFTIKEKSIKMLQNILENTTKMVLHILPEKDIHDLHWFLSTVKQSAFHITRDNILDLNFDDILSLNCVIVREHTLERSEHCSTVLEHCIKIAFYLSTAIINKTQIVLFGSDLISTGRNLIRTEKFGD